MKKKQTGLISLGPSGDDWFTDLPSVQATESLGCMLGRQLLGGEIIALTGDLGAGKTVLVRGLASGVEIDPELVTSPTFSLIHEYHGRIHLIHADLYRLESPQELANIGFHEYLNSTSTVVIEWAERMGKDLPTDRLEIHLYHQQRTSRKATLKATGAQSHDLIVKTLQQANH